MFTGRFWSRGVLVGAIIFLPAAWATAQEDDLFGDSAPAGPEGAAAPAAAAAEEPATETSAAERWQARHAIDDDAHTHTHANDFCSCVGEGDSAAVARIEKSLNSPLGTNGMDFTEVPLEEVVNLLQEEYGIPIQIDAAALEAAGLEPTANVTVNLHNVSLRSAVRLMLKKLQLTHIIQDEVLLITTPDEAEAQLATCVYDVRRFVDDTSNRSMEELMDTIVSCVSTETWAENGGGEAEIRSLKPGLLVISQTQAVHQEINSLLKAIHDMRQGGGANGAAMPGAGNEEVVTRLYVLKVKGDAEKLGDKVRDMIIQTIPDQQWAGQLPDGQSVTLTVLNDRIIVRQTPTVQEEVASLLQESGVAAPATRSDIRSGRGGSDEAGPAAGGGGGGGFFALPDHQPRESD